MEDNYLSHYGVKGMKWGKRKSLPTSSIRSNLNSTKAQYKSAKKAFNKSFHDAYNHAYQAYSPFKKRRQANADRWEKTSFGEKLLFNSTTRKKAAKYVVDNNMSMKEARKKANKQALRNTAAFIGVYGGIGIAGAALYKLNH